MFFFSEVFGRKIHKNKICDNGNLSLFDECTWKACGSDCKKGLTCQKGYCLVKEGGYCERSSHCISGHYWNRADRECRMNDFGYTIKEMNERLHDKLLK
jgi:hypothetical protein